MALPPSPASRELPTLQPAHPSVCHTRLSVGCGRGGALGSVAGKPWTLGGTRPGSSHLALRDAFPSLRVQHSHSPADGGAAAPFRHRRCPGRCLWVFALGGSEAVMPGICTVQGSWMTASMCGGQNKNVQSVKSKVRQRPPPWGKSPSCWGRSRRAKLLRDPVWLRSLAAKQVPKRSI